MPARRKPITASAKAMAAEYPGNRFLTSFAKREEARENVQAMMSVMLTPRDGVGWRGMLAVPPGSAIEKVLEAFRRETDIPLEIPFFAMLHYVSGILLKRETTLIGPVGRMSPELWTVVLAPSGSGKTFAAEIVEKAAELEDMALSEPASGAALLEALRDKPRGALWTQDEIAQKLKQIEDPKSPLGDAKEYLLRAYSNSRIERTTKKETITVENPRLGIFGLNTPESFLKALSTESLLDGFAQRFGFVWAEKDPARPMVDFPIYDKPKLEAACAQAFRQVLTMPTHAEYRLGSDATEAFAVSFGMLARPDTPESFHRRAMFRAFRYALVYHILLGKPSVTIDAEDVGWGARVVSLHMADMGKILGQDQQVKGMAAMVGKAKELKNRARLEGKPFTARTLQQSMREITKAEDARALFDLVKD